ncbi:hypothetical protein [Histidinibacterium lentulum]|uniref:Uncharacterized protein n=1 Tax=Histidinibacterium lentulum TaxID=2480588 RepID=A0A3N2QYJ3_9RHOB|nr:hypothetical protein [Histidinibacterium lentulum]ROU00284.1 hypothetical protein EAT49_13615 [Histidinibacterium lentulum]
MVYIIPVIGFLIGLGPGFLMARKGQAWAAAVLILVGIAAGVWMVLEGRAQTNGWDGIGYGIVAFLMIAPAVAGVTAGAIWGLVARSRSGQRAPHDRDTP